MIKEHPHSLLKKITDYDSVKKWSYNLAKQWVQEHLTPRGINSSRKFFDYKRNGGYLPKHFPRVPHENFGRKSTWISYRDFFGTENLVHKSMFLSFEKAREFMATVKEIQYSKDYLAWGQKPAFLPKRPNMTYKENWQGWDDFLSTKEELRKPANATLNESKVRIIKHQLKMGVPASILARTFKVSGMQITRIKRGENWGHVKV